MTMKNHFLLLLIVSICAILLLSACAPGPNPARNTAPEQGKVAGFWQGLWHGIIAPVTFVISLFNRSVGIYEVHNNGGWYNLGFLLGASIILHGSGRAEHHWHK
jgi:hypothetical protein